MDDKRIQHLTEAFAGIISMMLGALRVHGWRCLLHLPEIWLATRYIRRLGEAFAALMAEFKAGRLVLPPIAPCTALPEQEVAYTTSPEIPRPAARNRQRPAHRRTPPVAYAEPDRPEATSSAATLRPAHGQAAPRPLPFRFAMPVLHAAIIAPGRSC